jgi:hypothetical protein
MPSDSKNINALIPTRNGGLVSLETVYFSWKTHGIEKPQETSFPTFKIPSSSDHYILAESLQIILTSSILSRVGCMYKLPFTIQYKMKAEDSAWSDLSVPDQMTAAFVMYYMRQNQPEPVTKIIERRLLHDEYLLLTLSLSEDGKFDIDIRLTADDPMEMIPSRLIVNCKELEP